MVCNNCKKKIDDNLKYCTECGAPIEVEEIIDENTVRRAKDKILKSRIRIAISIIMVIILLNISIGIIKSITSTRTLKKDERFSNENWEITYVIPKGFKEDRNSLDNIRYYNYEKENIDCKVTMWRITYIYEEETEESLLKDHSYIYDENITIEDKDINGKKWLSIKHEDLGEHNYVYGKFSKKKDNYYLITLEDYEPEAKVCNKMFNKILKSIKYK